MSDTPRTDEIAIQMQPPVDAETAFHFMDCHARKLERELAEANTVSATLLATLLATKCRELAEVTKQRDELAKSLQLVWNHLKGERIRHDYITGTKEAGDLKTLQEVCKQALAAVKGGEL